MKEKEQILNELVELDSNIVKLNEEYDGKESISGLDVYNYVKSLCSYGTLLSGLRDYYDVNGYPLFENSHGDVSQATHYDVWRVDPEAASCHKNLKNVQATILRISPDFCSCEEFDDFLVELECRSLVGEYSVLESDSGKTAKIETLSRAASIFYATMVDKKDEDVDLDNFNMLQECFQLYKDEAGVQLIIHGMCEDGVYPTLYSGPQFGNYVEKMIASINEKTNSGAPKELKK